MNNISDFEKIKLIKEKINLIFKVEEENNRLREENEKYNQLKEIVKENEELNKKILYLNDQLKNKKEVKKENSYKLLAYETRIKMLENQLEKYKNTNNDCNSR